MGLTYVEGAVSAGNGEPVRLKFLVDSGARYTLLPHDAWQRLGLQPRRELDFILADGSVIKRGISECRIALPQGETATPVILGEPGDEPLLGVVTLEELGLMLNPFSRTLEPMRMMLA
jgi:clan AA aspartic protease